MKPLGRPLAVVGALFAAFIVIEVLFETSVLNAGIKGKCPRSEVPGPAPDVVRPAVVDAPQRAEQTQPSLRPTVPQQQGVPQGMTGCGMADGGPFVALRKSPSDCDAKAAAVRAVAACPAFGTLDHADGGGPVSKLYQARRASRPNGTKAALVFYMHSVQSLHEKPLEFENFQFFVRHGLACPSPDFDRITYVMVTNATGMNASCPAEDIVGGGDDGMSKVSVMWRTAKQPKSDLCAFRQVIDGFSQSFLDQFGTFVFLNSGTRGPFFRSDSRGAQAPQHWLDAFDAMFSDKNVHLVGATASVQISLHIQSHFLVLDRAGLSVARLQWECTSDMMTQIFRGEVSLTTDLLQGTTRAGPTWARSMLYPAVTFRGAKASGSFYKRVVHGNPFTSRFVDPCRVVFTKMGGSILKDIPRHTLDAVRWQTAFFDAAPRCPGFDGSLAAAVTRSLPLCWDSTHTKP